MKLNFLRVPSKNPTLSHGSQDELPSGGNTMSVFGFLAFGKTDA